MNYEQALKFFQDKLEELEAPKEEFVEWGNAIVAIYDHVKLLENGLETKSMVYQCEYCGPVADCLHRREKIAVAGLDL